MLKENYFYFPIHILLITIPFSVPVQGQTQTTETDKSAVPERVDVEPIAEDSQIRNRLVRILAATEWFENPEVEVNDGVVFLSGSTKTADQKS